MTSISPTSQASSSAADSSKAKLGGDLEMFLTMLTTQLKGRTVLRICLIHPETTEDDICHTIQRMYQYARALKKERVSNFS